MAFRNAIPLTAALAALLLAAGARADCTSQTIGSTTFHHCDDGTSGTSQRVGSTTFHHLDGESGTSQRVGETVFHHLDGRSGTSQRIGDTTFHHLDGVSGTSQRVGETTFHHFDDGTSGTSQTLGGTTFLHLRPGPSPDARRIPLLGTGGGAEREETRWKGLRELRSTQPTPFVPVRPRSVFPDREPFGSPRQELRHAPAASDFSPFGTDSPAVGTPDPFGVDLWD